MNIDQISMCYVYQWIRLDKLYKLMESFFFNCGFFFEITTFFIIIVVRHLWWAARFLVLLSFRKMDWILYFIVMKVHFNKKISWSYSFFLWCSACCLHTPHYRANFSPQEVTSVTGTEFITLFFFLRDFIFKKTLFEKLQYLKQEQ